MSYSLLELAHASLDVGQTDDALDFLNQYLEITPDDADALRLRASLLARMPDRAADALADLDSLRQFSKPTADDLRLFARLSESTGNVDAAIRARETQWAVGRDPRDAEALLQLLLKHNQAERAVSLLDTLPDVWTWRIWRGDAHAVLSEPVEAISHYRASLDTMPDTPLNAPLRDYLRDRIARLTT